MDFLDESDIEIPWRIAFFLAPLVIVAGQTGSFINSRLNDRTIMSLMIGAYGVIGVFVLANVLLTEAA